MKKDNSSKTAKKQALPLSNTSISDFNFPVDFQMFNIKPGDKMDYYFEVWDNDACTWPKIYQITSV
jgi:hypothetical protein